MKPEYDKFLSNKSHSDLYEGFKPLFMPSWLFDFQESLVDWAVRKGRAAIFADCGLGKGQPRGAMILTSGGFVPNTDLRIGDGIIASDGFSYQLKAKYDRGAQSIFRIRFSDEAELVVDSDHLHMVRTNNDRRRGRPWRILSTKELISQRLRYGVNRNSRNWDIPVVMPVKMPASRHWIHPYVLGVILGDGCISHGCTISSADKQIVDRVNSLLPRGWTLRRKISSKYDYALSKGGTNAREFIVELRRLGLFGGKSGNKFIPKEYLIDSVANRVSLLRGLMDTDGYIKSTSQFYSVSEQLATGALSLIRSLGGCPTHKIKQTSYVHRGQRRNGQPCHVLTFSLNTLNPFHLERKARLWNPNPRDNGRWIESIEPAGKAETICLSVDSPDQSYVTEHYIVTHNTPMQLVWAENVHRKTNKPVLILTPLAVSHQTIAEAEKFKIDARRIVDGKVHAGINVTNYERLSHLNPADFSGVVADESSILKSYNGVRRAEITDFMRKMPYRLLCTATAAPNDYIELGTSSEALGYLGHMDMLNRFFKNDHNNSATGRIRGEVIKWRFKGHAETAFWQWICSWARAVRKPSDLGFKDGKFILPPLKEQEHLLEMTEPAPDMLFTLPAVGLKEQRDERRRTIKVRCEKAASLVANTKKQALVWCHLNPEGDLLEDLIPGAHQVSGSDSDDAKEEKFIAFAKGEIRVLVTKPKIGAHGLNFQNCSHITFFPSHSFEQYYQGVRRCWRFGQKNPVKVDIVTTEGERDILKNLQRKADAADKMFSSLLTEMNHALHIGRDKSFTEKERVPKWL